MSDLEAEVDRRMAERAATQSTPELSRLRDPAEIALVAFVLGVLNLTGVIDISWWWVAAPIVLAAAFAAWVVAA